ncbi:MAG: 2-succinyl-6-hydroxy-2,4-cyclohexadiene-1-carboxylate synthase [Calditrichaeota bacterium]|nr:MAG: 2-succinyl-6-hydroxy-2,4-cyclohexadiene-1-carboxylate synthase [Calditrichota bacterium]
MMGLGRKTGLAFRQVGPGAATPVLFFHGFLGSGRDWLPVAERLAGPYTCYLVDLPGHGGSAYQFPRHFTLAGFSELLAGWVKEQGWSQVFLVGYSMGGRLALYFTCRYPELVAGTVAESASPGLAGLQERRERARQDGRWAKQLVQDGLSTFLHRWYRQPVFQGIEKRLFFGLMIRRRLQNNPRELARALSLMGLARQPDLRSCLQETKIPLLLVTGQNDTKFQTLARELVAANRAIRWVNIPGCGHNTHVENPARFARIVAAFFASVEQERARLNRP